MANTDPDIIANVDRASRETGLTAATIARIRVANGIERPLLDDVAPLPEATMNGEPVAIELPEPMEATTDFTRYTDEEWPS